MKGREEYENTKVCKKMFRPDLLLTGVVLQEIKPAILRCLIGLGTIFVSNLSQFVLMKVRSFPKAFFLKTDSGEHKRNFKKC